MARRYGLILVGVLLLAVGVFYTFNAYIQLRERGFAEALDIPVAIISLAIGAFALWAARRS